MIRQIYLDNHASTKLDPRVSEAMLPYFTEYYGNASSKTHSYGWIAEEAVDNAREIIALFIGAKKNEIIFTGGATESNNLALKGLYETYKEKKNRLIISSIEHSSIYSPAMELKAKGCDVIELKVNEYGEIDLDQLKSSINDKTFLVSIIGAHNEIGTVQNLQEIGRICKEAGVLFHSDLTQLIGKIKINVNDSNIDLASFNAHKNYGPKGVGALYIRKKSPRINIVPQITGGGQESDLRAGSLNVPAIAGFGKCIEISGNEMETDMARISALRDKLYHGISSNIPYVELNSKQEHRLGNNLNISFKDIPARELISKLNGVAVSTGAACFSGKQEPSRTLLNLGIDKTRASSAVRFGLGRFNSPEEIDKAVEIISEAVNKIRSESQILKMENI